MTTILKKRERKDDLSSSLDEPIKKRAKTSDEDYVPSLDEDEDEFIYPLSPKEEEEDQLSIPEPKVYSSDDDEYTYVYCGIIGCKNTYFTGKNGSICSDCGVNACESCSCKLGSYDDTDDEWYCEECTPIHEEIKIENARQIDLMLERARKKALKKRSI